MALYSIKDLERLTGVKAHTIRIWEKRYNIVEPRRTESNIRFYCDHDVKKLMNISILLRHGYKISRLAGFDQHELSKKVMEVSIVSNGHDSLIENMVISMIEMDESRFEKILNQAIIKEGFENAVFKILYPFFERIGVLWQTGSINPAHEHFITNLVKQKIYVAIDSLSVTPGPSAKTFLLFLPEWDLHDLGLLVYDYLIKSNGHKVIFLGQNVPEEDIYAVSDFLQPDYFLIGFSNSVQKEKLEAYIGRLSERYPSNKIFITGLQTSGITCELAPNVVPVRSAHHFTSEILPEIN
ncbi:MAG: MerR family transcriptional regulator [Bacteroidales bacterium]|jgi:MerR family transcriptional regulator, light-induced transcriptional regulator